MANSKMVRSTCAQAGQHWEAHRWMINSKYSLWCLVHASSVSRVTGTLLKVRTQRATGPSCSITTSLGTAHLLQTAADFNASRMNQEGGRDLFIQHLKMWSAVSGSAPLHSISRSVDKSSLQSTSTTPIFGPWSASSGRGFSLVSRLTHSCPSQRSLCSQQPHGKPRHGGNEKKTIAIDRDGEWSHSQEYSRDKPVAKLVRQVAAWHLRRQAHKGWTCVAWRAVRPCLAPRARQ